MSHCETKLWSTVCQSVAVFSECLATTICWLDDLLRGIDNRSLVHIVREMAPQAAIIANAIAIDEIHKIYEAGADYVYLNRFEAAWTLQRAIQAGIDQQIDVFRNERQSRNHYSPDRKEILS